MKTTIMNVYGLRIIFKAPTIEYAFKEKTKRTRYTKRFKKALKDLGLEEGIDFDFLVADGTTEDPKGIKDLKKHGLVLFTNTEEK